MKTLMRTNNRLENLFNDPMNTVFGRTVDDILEHDFFSSFDADLRDDGDSYCIEIPVPGLTRRDISLEMDQSVMRVSARREQKNNSRNNVSFSRSQLYRSFVLPEDADENRIHAKCRDGLLTIKVGKTKMQSMRRSIKVHGEDSLTSSSQWQKLKHNLRQLFK